MWPFLRAGEQLIIKKYPVEKLKAGDIILYKSDSMPVCHRLVRKIRNKNGYLFYVRGDNSTCKPELVKAEDICGKVIGVFKDANNLIDFSCWYWIVINQLIVLFAPLISTAARTVKPLYVRITR